MNEEQLKKQETRANHEQRDAAVNRCLDYLFANGSGQRAERLVLTSKEGRDLGGWGRPAMRDVIAKVFDAGYTSAESAWVPVTTFEEFQKHDYGRCWITTNDGRVEEWYINFRDVEEFERIERNCTAFMPVETPRPYTQSKSKGD